VYIQGGKTGEEPIHLQKLAELMDREPEPLKLELIKNLTN